MGAQRDDLFGSVSTLARLSRFILPHWHSVGFAFLHMLGDAGMNLLKPWPLKFAFDKILKQPALDRPTLYLLIAISLAVVAITALEGFFVYLVAYLLNGAGRTI